MTLSLLSLEQLSKALSDSPSHEALFQTLSQYEDEAALLFNDNQISGDANLLSAFYSSFLISHLLTNQLHEARAATHRLPQTLVASDAVLQNTIALLRAVWQHKPSEVYRILRHLPWPEPVNIIIRKYEAYYTEKSFGEISRAFEAIRPDVAAEYLGLDPSSNVVEALTQKGWTWDAQAQLLRPNLPTEPVKLDGQRTNGIPRLVGLVNKAS
ncbi:hypothetical protein VTN49DRAFT_6116 [Thermomyces lanuginosus]|uniref:uncharacterized protein n=1 Tax=Thermomyces lanuginosus TaxID=5541 RepID=UPI0037448033